MGNCGLIPKNDAMFRGISVLNLDAKGRLAIPTRYRDGLLGRDGGQVVITLSDRWDEDHCLWLLPLGEWVEIERKLLSIPTGRQSTRLKRTLLSFATECELDRSGRALIPAQLRERAGLEKRIVLTGQGNKFEIWDEVRWDDQCDSWLSEPLDQDGALPIEMETLVL